MLTKFLIRTWILLIVPTAVFAKRGGGGGGGDGGDSDGSSDDDSGSSSGDSCGEYDSFLETWDIYPEYLSESNATVGGSFFQGEAFFNYKIPGPQKYGHSPCEGEWESLRMLGYAWVGPQSEYPKGSENPFIIGFKAWGSNNPVENISTSYTYLSSTYCPSKPDLVRFLTTDGVDEKWTQLENTGGTSTISSYFPQRAADFFSLNVTANTTDSEAVDFGARFVEDGPDPGGNPNLLQLTDGAGSDREWISIGWSERMVVNGSITNTTLDFSIVGNGTVPTENSTSLETIDSFAGVNITFSGTFHSANSSEKPSIRSKDQPLVSFVENDAFEGSGARVVHVNYAVGMVWTICMALLFGYFL